MNGGIRNAVMVLGLIVNAAPGSAAQFDHGYAAYAQMLARHVHAPGVDYAALKLDREALDRAVAALDSEASRGEPGWARAQRMAFWINAYNLFTLRAIVDHYPIRSGWLTRHPRNSIRQIDGVWTHLTWSAAGRAVTLDDIEHRILRPEFKDARVHFAVNCASVSCPPLAAEPYRPATLGAQLDAAARHYFASGEGLRVEGGTIRVSSLFKWYGEDFIAEFAPLVTGTRDPKERAILGAIVRYGPAAAAAEARRGTLRIAFLPYDWSLNDAPRRLQRPLAGRAAEGVPRSDTPTPVAKISGMPYIAHVQV